MSGKFRALETAADYSAVIGCHRFKQTTFSCRGKFIRPLAGIEALARMNSTLHLTRRIVTAAKSMDPQSRFAERIFELNA